MKNFLKSVLFSISIFALFIFCAGGDDESYFGKDYGYSLFTPEVINEKRLEPFFRTSSMYYGHSTQIQGFYEQNIIDWQTYFENQLDTSTIKKLLYSTQLPQIDTLIFFLKNQEIKISAGLRNNQILKLQNKTKSLDFLYYLGFALRSEIFSNTNATDWEYSPVSFKDNDLILKLIKGGIRQEANVQDKFIKERYLFQSIRLYYFNEDYIACEAFFEKNKANFIANSNTYYRAMGYTAAALYKRKQYGKANYYYSLIFKNCLLLKESALWSFHPQEDVDFNQAILLAKNNTEKCTMYFMFGYVNDEIRAIKEISKLDNNSLYMEILLTRAINKEEENILNETSLGLIDKKVNPVLLEIIRKESANPQHKKKAVWYLALGYLNILSDDLVGAEIQFKNAEKQSQEPLLLKSISLYRAIKKIKSQTVLNEKVELELLPSIQLLLAEDTTEQYLRKSIAINWMKNRLAKQYEKQNEPLKAECWQHHSVKLFYEKYENLDKMIAFINPTARNEYEKLLKSLYPYSVADMIRLQVLFNVYNDNLTAALKKLEKEPEAGNNTLKGDPFIIHINDCHDCDHEAEKKEEFSVYEFLKRMDEKIKTSEKTNDSEQKAHLLFEVANGYYNITHFGNGRSFYEGSAGGYDEYFNFDYLDDNNRAYTQSKIFDCQLSAKYYQKALDASKNIEFKAMCTFMLAKCEQNQFYRIKLKTYEGDFKAGQYFANLKNSYKTTKYYKEVIRECGYFSTYIQKK